MIRRPSVALLLCALFLLAAGPAVAHFGMVIPSRSMVVQPPKASKGGPSEAAVRLNIAFAHPFELVGMDMERPDKVEAIQGGQRQDITPTLTAGTFLGKAAWSAQYVFKRPGVAMFCVSPRPYYEPAEDLFIVHYAKTIVAAFGDEDGWDEPAGLKTEIIPLTRPFGNYAGNVFQGRVLVGGKPAAGAEVEVEYLNDARRYAAPNDYLVTQKVKADPNGVFTFACPKAGWWGFSALSKADYKLQKDGKDKDVELGAVLWVEMLDYQPAAKAAGGK